MKKFPEHLLEQSRTEKENAWRTDFIVRIDQAARACETVNRRKQENNIGRDEPVLRRFSAGSRTHFQSGAGMSRKDR